MPSRSPAALFQPVRTRAIPALCSLLAVIASLAHADDKSSSSQKAKDGDTDIFELSADVQNSLFPLFRSVADAKVSRTTVELVAETIAGGQVVDARTSTYQIASRRPDKFTVYLKEPDGRTRIYSDGKKVSVALSPEAYFQIDDPISIADAVDELPVPMGPFPEPVLALSLAGYDPAITLVGGMKSIDVVDRQPFRGSKKSVHLRGVQDDGVVWDLWVEDGESRRPLRMIVDLTSMLRANDQLNMPAGFQYRLRFDFLSWRMTGTVDDKLFVYVPPTNATKFESLDDYLQSLAGVASEHPLLGQPMPEFAGMTIEEKAVLPKDWKNKVVVLDFWATWCEPCLAGIPTAIQVTEKFADQDALYFTINVGEVPESVRGFMSEQSWEAPVIADPETEISKAFRADAIPLRIVIGKSGKIESAHVGFQGTTALRKRLTDELDVLTIGGRIGSATESQD